MFAGVEATLTVFGPVWLLGAAQRHLHRRAWWAGQAAGRAAYGAFILQGPVLIGLAVAMRPLPLPAEAKGLAVVAGSFALARLLITRIRGLARVL